MWFLMYFPIANPMYVEGGKTGMVHIWRRVPSLLVRYEWCVGERAVTMVHYLNGLCQTIGLHT